MYLLYGHYRKTKRIKGEPLLLTQLTGKWGEMTQRRRNRKIGASSYIRGLQIDVAFLADQ
jgi:hypothetical protein